MLHIHKISMQRFLSRRWLWFAAVVAIAAIFSAGCSSDDDAEPEAPTTTVAPTSATAATATTAAPPSTAPPTTTATTAPPLAPPEYDITAGINHSCTINEGRVLCWGSNMHGQLGNGESGAAAYSSIPVEAQGITDAVAVGAGWEHTCAVHATGEVSCWGDDTSGELGNGETADSVPEPVKAVGLDDAVDVTAGHWHTCALRSTGEVSCWGPQPRRTARQRRYRCRLLCASFGERHYRCRERKRQRRAFLRRSCHRRSLMLGRQLAGRTRQRGIRPRC